MYMYVDTTSCCLTRLSDGRTYRFSEVIVFAIGGGCYAEHNNLQELVRQRHGAGGVLRSVLYGCSELLSGDHFLAQLEILGAR